MSLRGGLLLLEGGPAATYSRPLLGRHHPDQSLNSMAVCPPPGGPHTMLLWSVTPGACCQAACCVLPGWHGLAGAAAAC